MHSHRFAASFLLFSVLTFLDGCHGGSDSAADLQVRNTSNSAITFEFDIQTDPGSGIDRTKLILDPWRQGLCPATRIGLPTGLITVTVSGPQVDGFPMHSWTVASGEPPDLNVLVDAGGKVTFDASMPPQTASCELPPLRTPPP
jgi:hypothetical protein